MFNEGQNPGSKDKKVKIIEKKGESERYEEIYHTFRGGIIKFMEKELRDYNIGRPWIDGNPIFNSIEFQSSAIDKIPIPNQDHNGCVIACYRQLLEAQTGRKTLQSVARKELRKKGFIRENGMAVLSPDAAETLGITGCDFINWFPTKPEGVDWPMRLVIALEKGNLVVAIFPGQHAMIISGIRFNSDSYNLEFIARDSISEKEVVYSDKDLAKGMLEYEKATGRSPNQSMIVVEPKKIGKKLTITLIDRNSNRIVNPQKDPSIRAFDDRAREQERQEKLR